MFFSKKEKMTPQEIHQINYTLSHNENYASIMALYCMGDTAKDINEAFPNKTPEVLALQAYLEAHNITIQQAVPIYQYSVDSEEMLSLKRGKFTIDEKKVEMKSQLLENLSKLYPENVANYYCERIINFANTYNFVGKGEYQINTEFSNYAKSIGIPIGVVTSYSYEIGRLHRVEENLKMLENVLQNSELKEDAILYRAVGVNHLASIINGDWKNLIGQDIVNDFPTSTSKDYESSFVNYKDKPLILSIHVKKGTKGFDIEPLSSYGTEQEVLLANNTLHINDIRFGLINGESKVIADCDIYQKEFSKSNLESSINYMDGFSDLTKLSTKNSFINQEEKDIDLSK